MKEIVFFDRTGNNKLKIEAPSATQIPQAEQRVVIDGVAYHIDKISWNYDTKTIRVYINPQ